MADLTQVGLLPFVQITGPGLRVGDQIAGVRFGLQPVHHGLDLGQLFAARGRASLRHDRGHVPVQHAGGLGE